MREGFVYLLSLREESPNYSTPPYPRPPLEPQVVCEVRRRRVVCVDARHCPISHASPFVRKAAPPLLSSGGEWETGGGRSL
jgi:hypothetical protein